MHYCTGCYHPKCIKCGKIDRITTFQPAIEICSNELLYPKSRIKPSKAKPSQNCSGICELCTIKYGYGASIMSVWLKYNSIPDVRGCGIALNIELDKLQKYNIKFNISWIL